MLVYCRSRELTYTDTQVWTAGQVVGLIQDIPTCAELVKRIEREAIDTLTSSLELAWDPRTGGPARANVDAAKSHENNPQAQVWGVGEKAKL